jgi:protein involved in polysaccharide export with SLBB domain
VIKLTETLKDTIPNGRVVIDVENKSFIENLILKDGDMLTIPEKSDHIYIYGEVSYEGALKYEDLEQLSYYINKSGGLKDNADKEAIYVLHPNGDTQKASIKKNLFQNSPSNQLQLYPGSIIFVPRAIDNSATTRLAAQAYVSILGNIGIALASLSSINNN